MLRKYSNSRSLSDNIKLGSLSAFAAGMVNIGSLLLFFSFSSNVTGHYAILAAEIVKGNYYQIAVVFSWIFLFFFGSFTSNMFVIHINQRNSYLAHAIPLILEILCLMFVGIYGEYFYKETLVETEYLLALMLFAMGLQNGLTASISNFSVKTTHLTGTTTDLGILFSMFTKKEYRNNEALIGKAKLLVAIKAVIPELLIKECVQSKQAMQAVIQHGTRRLVTALMQCMGQYAVVIENKMGLTWCNFTHDNQTYECLWVCY